MYKLLTAS